MTKKKRREMRWSLTLSIMIAAIPLSIIFLGDLKLSLPDSLSFSTDSAPQTEHPSKVLPVLANN